ncbi:hypothetical protein Tco_0191229 [Tanacetum coccineum]
MADENVLVPAPTRSDDQILLVAAWIPIGKRNYNTLTYEEKSGIYNFELDETRFVLDANLLREALEITPIDQAYQFVSPLTGEAIMDFVNELGYTEVIHFVSRMAVNNLSQPWRAILYMINQCLTGKTSGHDRPRYLVLQMLWGIITCSNIDFAELMWEEFLQAIQTFLTDKANLGSPTKKGRKDKAHVIPYCQFTKLIICHLGRTNDIHPRSASPFHLAEDDLRLGNLKFVPKGEDDDVFGMPTTNDLISNNIRNASYYNGYMEMVAKHDQKVASQKEGNKKSASTKQPKPKPAIEKTSKPAPAPKPKVTKEKPSNPTTAKPPKPKPAKEKSTKPTPLQKAGKAHSEPKPEPTHQGEGEDFEMERAIQMSLESFQAQSQAHVGVVAIREPIAEATRPFPVVEGKGKAIVTEEQAAQSLLALHTPKRRKTTNQFILQRRAPTIEEASTGPSALPLDGASTNIVLLITEELGEDVEKQETVEENTVELDEDQAGSDPGETYESQPPPEQARIDEDQARPAPRISHVALAGPDPEPTHDKFMADLYPKVQESLKFPADEHVILEDSLSSTRTLSSMKNLEDAYAIGDQLINDKSTDDEPGELSVEAKVVSIVIVPIYQASLSVPPLSTPVIDLSPFTMDDNRTMAQLLEAPTEGYEDAIVVPEIIADNFELKHGLLTLVKELHQLDTFYNALNSNDQDSLNFTADGNFLDKMPYDCLRIIESKSKVRNSRNKLIVAKVSASSSTPGISPDVAELKDMVKALLLDKKNQTQALAPLKAVEESCVTCGGAHAYQNCPATDGNVYRDNIQEYVSQAAAANFNQGNTGSGTLPSNTITNPKEDLKGITTRSGVAYQGPTIPTTTSPPKVVERETKVTKDMVPPTNNGSTKDVQPPVVQVQPQVPNSEPVVAPVSAPMPNPKPSIPYPSRLNNQKIREKDQSLSKWEKSLFSMVTECMICRSEPALIARVVPSQESSYGLIINAFYHTVARGSLISIMKKGWLGGDHSAMASLRILSRNSCFPIRNPYEAKWCVLDPRDINEDAPSPISPQVVAWLVRRAPEEELLSFCQKRIPEDVRIPDLCRIRVKPNAVTVRDTTWSVARIKCPKEEDSGL